MNLAVNLFVGLAGLSGASVRLRSSRCGAAIFEGDADDVVALVLGLVHELQLGLEELRESLADEEWQLLVELRERAVAVGCVALRAREEIDEDHPAAEAALEVALLGEQLAALFATAAIRH